MNGLFNSILLSSAGSAQFATFPNKLDMKLSFNYDDFSIPGDFVLLSASFANDSSTFITILQSVLTTTSISPTRLIVETTGFSKKYYTINQSRAVYNNVFQWIMFRGNKQEDGHEYALYVLPQKSYDLIHEFISKQSSKWKDQNKEAIDSLVYDSTFFKGEIRFQRLYCKVAGTSSSIVAEARYMPASYFTTNIALYAQANYYAPKQCVPNKAKLRISDKLKRTSITFFQPVDED